MQLLGDEWREILELPLEDGGAPNFKTFHDVPGPRIKMFSDIFCLFLLPCWVFSVCSSEFAFYPLLLSSGLQGAVLYR